MTNLRLAAVVTLVAAAAAALASTAVAVPKATAGSTAGVACGTTATIGYLGPTTGPVASIGDELRKWALLAVNQWNANKNNKPKIKVV